MKSDGQHQRTQPQRQKKQAVREASVFFSNPMRGHLSRRPSSKTDLVHTAPDKTEVTQDAQQRKK